MDICGESLLEKGNRQSQSLWSFCVAAAGGKGDELQGKGEVRQRSGTRIGILFIVKNYCLLSSGFEDKDQ